MTPRQRIEIALRSAKQQVMDLEAALQDLPEDKSLSVSDVVLKHVAKAERAVVKKSKKA